MKFTKVCLTGFLLLALPQCIHAQQVVARDSANLYQKKASSHVKRVLLYNYTLGSHDKGPMLRSMTRLANKYGFRLDVGGSPSSLTFAALGSSGPDTVNPVNVAVFSNGDGDPFSGGVEIAVIKDFIQVKGRGLLMSHAAASYIPCPTSGTENLDDPNCKWLARVVVRQYLAHDMDPNMARIYVDSTKAGEVPPNSITGTPVATINHGKSNPEFKGIFAGLPGNDGVVGGVQTGIWDSVGDEWFNYRGYVRQQGAQTFDGVLFGPVVCLFSLDEAAPYFTTAIQKMGDRVEAWGRHVGNGLTAYNNAGHSDVYVRTRKFRGAVVNDSLEEKINWNLIRYLARDFVGCMDSKYKEYNPEATISFITPGIDDTLPCKTLNSTFIRLVKGRFSPNITLNSGGMQISMPNTETCRIVVTNAKGIQVFSKPAIGGNKKIEIRGLHHGIYFVRLMPQKSPVIVARVNLE